MKLNKYNREFKKYGTTMISPKDSFILPKDFKIIEKNLHLIKRENVKIGDAGEKNSVHVARLMTDVKKPKVVNHRYSKKVLDILKKKYLSVFKSFLKKKKLFIRRAQVNYMGKEQFVGLHLDKDSNPDYLVAVVIQLGSKFTGGGYKVYRSKKRKKIFNPKYQSLIISDCNIPHEVLKVKSGKRVSFVFFLSENFSLNKRKAL